MMRILLADNDSRVCSALNMLLDNNPGWQVVGLIQNTKTLLTRANELNPDLIVLDWYLVGNPSSQTLDELHHVKSKPKIIVISGRPELELDALANGADAFVSKIDPPDNLLNVIYKLLEKHSCTLAPVYNKGEKK